ncbi:S41 family peptidase [Aureisphaera galaxeae]|uniref:S41 family peptidase n=1 Tax=Aureisphaera galaxeae TaxID=1538023 RepID=UPI0023501843|nr:S41 family peptidase [Aureisphaera galaxeae]MDC8003914.1 S41 family peptidase [Aureisphaera galaxeae]
MKKILISVVILFHLMSCAQVNVTTQVSEGQAKKWRSDLVKMHNELKERHVDIYHTVSEESLDSAVNLLYEDIPQLSTSQILVRIAQIVAMIGDGHTSFYPSWQKKKEFHVYPIKFWSFSDGIYVTSTTEDYKEFLGKKLMGIDRTPIDEVFDKISTIVGADNDMEYVYSVPFGIPWAELLYVLGIADSHEKAEFHFENGSTTLLPLTFKKWRNAEYITANTMYPNGKSPSQRVEALFATPLIVDSLKFKKRPRYYWYKHLEEENAIFFQYNVCWDQKDRPSFATMMDNMFRELEETNTERLIIDLRQNTGGEPMIAQPLIDALKERKAYVDEGRVFVLVSRRTFSAALTNAVHLRKVGARTVGEAPRGKPNNPSEGRDIDLKSTKIWLTVSTQFVERDPDLGDQDYLPIDIKYDMPFDDFRNARDGAFHKAMKAELFN